MSTLACTTLVKENFIVNLRGYEHFCPLPSMIALCLHLGGACPLTVPVNDVQFLVEAGEMGIMAKWDFLALGDLATCTQPIISQVQADCPKCFRPVIDQ